MQIYSGAKPISWDDFYEITKGLALAVAGFDPEIILGVARGGMYPGTLLSHFLRKEFYPVRLTRRENDVIVKESPVWKVKPPEIVKGKRVLIVDEICGKGETLSLVKNEVQIFGAAEIKCAVLYSHSQGVKVPDYIGLISDELFLNPWDREVLVNGKFEPHPEYVEELAKLGLQYPLRR